jgi:hypothetical protein
MFHKIKPLDIAIAKTAFIIALIIPVYTGAQFIDNFNDKTITRDARGQDGWNYFAGDGTAVMDFSESGNGYASITVDATKDKQGIWWALIKRQISKGMTLELLKNPNYALRIESRIRVSSAPKRVNLCLNTERTTDFDTNLMEFDISDTVNWHTISLTIPNFDAVPGDTVYGQLALMDWGFEKYRIDIDYFRVDIVKIDSAGPDNGVQVPYRPPIPGISKFNFHEPAAQNGIIDLQFPNKNFGNWRTVNNGESISLLTVSGTQYVIFRWDLSKFAGKKINGSGLLELTTYSLQRSSDYNKDFGMVRVCEITGGNPGWDGKNVTLNNMCEGTVLSNVINSQMFIDINVKEKLGDKNFITVSQPVLQRLIDGKTLGIAIKPLGAVNASFFSINNKDQNLKAKLHFNIKTED